MAHESGTTCFQDIRENQLDMPESCYEEVKVWMLQVQKAQK